MQRLTISIEDDLAEAFDQWCARNRYRNRSEAVRDLMRRKLADEAVAQGNGPCVAILSYSFDHHTRQLASRLVERQHHHSALIISTTHVHIDQDHCIESVLLRGPIGEVERLAASLMAETGIENGRVHYFPAVGDSGPGHPHDHDHEHPHGHGHGAGQGAE